MFHRKDFLGTALRTLRATLLLIVAMQFLEYRGVLAGPEGAMLDSLTRSPTARAILTVEIDDAAYQKCFDATSPIHPRTVFGLVKGVHSAGPAVIGVNIVTDTEEHNPTYRALAEESPELKDTAVWTAGADAAKFDTASFPGWMIGKEDRLIVRPTRILGFEPEEATRRAIRWGVPVFPKDSDLHLRRFPRGILFSADPASSMHAEEKSSWAKIVAERYCEGRGCRILDSEVHETLIPYSQAPERRFNALDLFQCSDGRVAPGGPLWTEFQEMAKGRIVMIGGAFGSARNAYETPIGRIPGLLVNAYAVQAEINGAGIQARHLAAVLFDLAVGIGIGCIAWMLRKRGMRAVMTASLGLLLTALLLTFWQFGRGYVLSFMGLMVGLLLHQVYEIKRR